MNSPNSPQNSSLASPDPSSFKIFQNSFIRTTQPLPYSDLKSLKKSRKRLKTSSKLTSGPDPGRLPQIRSPPQVHKKLLPEPTFDELKAKIEQHKVIETWINDTLKEAEYLPIPEVLVKPQNKLPISRYGIDRLTLSTENLSTDMIERLYKTLFVYTTGFHELIKDILSNLKFTL